MQDSWRRIGCAELFIATMNPASLHLIILLNYYQSSPTVTFIWSCFHLPQKTFVDIILILRVCHNMPISIFFLYIIFVFLFYKEVYYWRTFSHSKPAVQKRKKPLLPVFHISRWRNYFKVFFKVSPDKSDWFTELYMRLDLIKRG